MNLRFKKLPDSTRSSIIRVQDKSCRRADRLKSIVRQGQQLQRQVCTDPAVLQESVRQDHHGSRRVSSWICRCCCGVAAMADIKQRLDIALLVGVDASLWLLETVNPGILRGLSTRAT
jgi:hypothetical protein